MLFLIPLISLSAIFAAQTICMIKPATAIITCQAQVAIALIHKKKPAVAPLTKLERSLKLIKKIKKTKKCDQFLVLAYIKNHIDQLDFNIQDSQGNTALIWSVIKSHDLIFEFLMSKKVILDKQNLKGFTALTWAILANNKEFITKLIKASCTINIPDQHERVPLMWAVAQEDQEIIQILLEAGASPRSCDDQNDDSLDWAQDRKRKDIYQQILQFEQKKEQKYFFA